MRKMVWGILMAKQWMFDWQDGGQMVCLRETEKLWHINPLREVGADVGASVV